MHNSGSFMAKKTGFAIFLTKEAVEALAGTYMAHFIHDNEYLDCKTFEGDVPYCQCVALANGKDSFLKGKYQEFYFPDEYVLFAVVDKYPNSPGFQSPG